MTLYKGDLEWTVPDGDSVTLAKFNVKTRSRTDVAPSDTESALDLEGDDGANVQGFELAGEAKLELLKGGKALLSGNVELPKVFTDAEGKGLTGAVQVESDNEHGVHLGGMQIKAPLVFVGKVEVHNLFVTFTGERNGDAKGSCNADSPGPALGGRRREDRPADAGPADASRASAWASPTAASTTPRARCRAARRACSIGAGIRVQKIAITVCAGPPVTVEGRIA